MYEAVARGMKALRGHEWSGPGAFQASRLDVIMKQSEVTHKVSLKKFSKWLERERGSPRDSIQRQKVRSILDG